MMSYYKERVIVLEEQLNLAKTGIVKKMKDIGNGLMNTNDYEGVCKYTEDIAKSVCAVKELEDSLVSAKKNLADAEAEKATAAEVKNEDNQ